MSRSLAFVGILTMIGMTGSLTVYAQDEVNPTTSGVIVKNHISDAERDQLMRKAMEDARLELEKQKAANQAEEQQKAEIKARAAEADRLAAQARDQAASAKAEQIRQATADAQVAAEKKAEEQRVAAKLANDEKAKSDAATVKAQATAKSDVKDLDKVKPEVTEKNTYVVPKKAPAIATPKHEKTTPEIANKSDETKVGVPEKVVIESAPTKDPKSAITVKTVMPAGDEARKAEQLAARHTEGSGVSTGESKSDHSSSNASKSLSGQVIGVMRSSDGRPRILLTTDDHQMIQVVLEDEDAEIPAPGASVSVRGREVGGANGRPVISARSVSIKSATKTQHTRMQPPVMMSADPSSDYAETDLAPELIDPGAPMMLPPMGIGMGMGMMPPPMMMGPGGPMMGGGRNGRF